MSSQPPEISLMTASYDDPEDTPTRQKMPSATSEPVATNGHDARVESDSDRLDRELTARAFEAVPLGKDPSWYTRMAAVFSFKSAEHAANAHEVSGKALREATETRRYVQALVEKGSVAPARPPLPSVHEDDFEVVDKTVNGTPIYRVSAPQMEAVRETDRRHQMALFAVGEQERINAAVVAALAQQALVRDAAPKRFLVGVAGPKALTALLVAGVLALGTYVATKLSSLLHH